LQMGTERGQGDRGRGGGLSEGGGAEGERGGRGEMRVVRERLCTMETLLMR